MGLYYTWIQTPLVTSSREIAIHGVRILKWHFSKFSKKQTHATSGSELARNITNTFMPQPMPSVWYSLLHHSAIHIEQSEKKLERHFKRISQLLKVSLGEDWLRFVTHIKGPPTHLVVKVPPQQRFKICQYFASCGIETSWLYHPLHMQDKITVQHLSKDFPQTIQIASSNVLLPFSSNHTEKEIDHLCTAIRDM